MEKKSPTQLICTAFSVVLTGLMMLSGCDDRPADAVETTEKPESVDSPVQSPDVSTTKPTVSETPSSAITEFPSIPDGPKLAVFCGMMAEKPATWIKHPPHRRTQIINYTVPGRGNAHEAHIDVFYFGPPRNNTGIDLIEANINRWIGQFRTTGTESDPVEATVTREVINEIPITIVELSGDRMEVHDAYYSTDQALISVIAERPQGLVYIQFHGQNATIEANREQFLTMIRTLREIPEQELPKSG